MVKKEDLLKVFFIYLCLCHVVPGHPCGSNPLRRFRPLSRMLGKDINSLLNLLRNSNPALYRQVHTEWRLYADCVGLVDTGYFKRSGPQENQDASPAAHNQSVHEASGTKAKSARGTKLIRLLRLALAAAGGEEEKETGAALDLIWPEAENGTKNAH